MKHLFGIVIVSLVSITLFGFGCQTNKQATLTLSNGNVYAPASDISIDFIAPYAFKDTAWITLVSSDVSHDEGTDLESSSIDVEYLNGRTSGTVTLLSPPSEGSFDIRLISSKKAGKEEASVTVALKGEPIGGDVKSTIQTDKKIYAPGELMTVTFTAPSTLDPLAFIGIIPSEVEHGTAEATQSIIDYDYLGGEKEGTRLFEVPSDPGTYDLRMFSKPAEGDEIKYISFTVEVEE